MRLSVSLDGEFAAANPQSEPFPVVSAREAWLHATGNLLGLEQRAAVAAGMPSLHPFRAPSAALLLTVEGAPDDVDLLPAAPSWLAPADVSALHVAAAGDVLGPAAGDALAWGLDIVAAGVEVGGQPRSGSAGAQQWMAGRGFVPIGGNGGVGAGVLACLPAGEDALAATLGLTRAGPSSADPACSVWLAPSTHEGGSGDILLDAGAASLQQALSEAAALVVASEAAARVLG